VRVIIAGGGTGGLATAIALRKAGIEPLVLEQAPAFTAIGAGLGLYVNAMKALGYLGADAYWRQTAARIDVAEQRGLNDDGLITSSSLEPQTAKYGEPYYCGHRADLMTSLLTALPPECVRTGSRVVAFAETARDVGVELDNGEEVRGDLLVGADGLRSRIRTLLMGEREARSTGVVVWRGLIPRDKVPERYDAKIMSWLGPHRHVLLYPLRHAEHPDSVYSLSAFVPTTEVHRESWTASGDLADLHASLADACPAMHELLALMDASLITPIYFRDPLESWGSDRIVLLGDAAHPAPPSAGQGAGMALEDAVMLAACLRRPGRGTSGRPCANTPSGASRAPPGCCSPPGLTCATVRPATRCRSGRATATTADYDGSALSARPCRNGSSRTTRSPPRYSHPQSSRRTWSFPATRCAGRSRGRLSTCGTQR
jgi:salicylate hydroxylase